ncbi:unnamed protein product [Caenorhabditis auriculariae]|uniref:Uncharacterized protein n=1 Tax=Caenorhabditis auriculariae TaxID=2777116 RepID=A0A8S1GWP2_9PELO|nr:unnamed protein product [Caenorhabditis auriculariae]
MACHAGSESLTRSQRHFDDIGNYVLCSFMGRKPNVQPWAPYSRRPNPWANRVSAGGANHICAKGFSTGVFVIIFTQEIHVFDQACQ